MTPSTELARALVSALVEAGVREIVVAPGSRNAPLSFAAYDAAAAGSVRLHTRLDERSAGFLALGLTKVGSRAAVICTSGTAVANLHPALLEAAHAGVPMIALTADRPARLRGTDANQTTDQVGLFGPLIPTIDLADPAMVRDVLPVNLTQAHAERHGPPLHVNVQVDDPLVPGERWAAAPGVRAGRARGPFLGGDGEVTELAAGPRTVVVAGDDAGPPARVLAQDAGWPLFAEPSSGSRTGDHAIRCYRLLLDGPLGHEIERVVVYGHPTLSRPVSRLLAREDIDVWAAPTPGRELRRAHPVAGTFERARASAPDGTDWFARWR
ncbi:MAG: 2-succinyl-5-enolpyruvyl-6-hydroxy-3-cyclohexene-carboxylate synthase, partial [Nocardioidaceae bacterium]|nr:2-succinyl-5-enolpyruvyl-6-hydroxy-3-cyclohexene-carboxylate synthase [Nocardioidaceae bacterium]